MNLFLNPSMKDFQKLIRQANPNPTVHNLVIDGDGEVLIDPELNNPALDINRFPFRFRLRTDNLIGKSAQAMRYVYDFLLMEWESRMKKKLAS
jgi:hypothetical protein